VVPRAKHNGAARIYCIGYIDDDGLKIKTLCHSKMKEGAVRRHPWVLGRATLWLSPDLHFRPERTAASRSRNNHD
jgi:hypothetical protein